MHASRLILGRVAALFLTLAAASVVATRAMAQAPQAPPVSPAPAVVTPAVAALGKLKPNSTTEATFTITNTGPAPITVKTTQPSCKCTGISNIIGKQIPVGGSIELKAALKAPPVPGDKDAKVFITFEEFPKSAVIATLKGEVEMAIAAKPPYVDSLKPPMSGTIELHAVDGKPFKILSAGNATPVFVEFDPARDAPRDRYTLKWALGGVKPMPIWWTVETDRLDCPLIPLRVRHESTGYNWDQERLRRQWWHKDQLVLGEIMKPGVPKEFTIELELLKDPRVKNFVVNPEWSTVTGIVTNHPELDARIVDSKLIGEALEVRVELMPKPTANGLIATTLTLTTATGSGPIPFFARVEDAPAAPAAPAGAALTPPPADSMASAAPTGSVTTSSGKINFGAIIGVLAASGMAFGVLAWLAIRRTSASSPAPRP